MNYNGKDLWLYEQQNMQTFFMENYKMQFRDFEQKEKDGLKYIIVKHQFFPNRVIDVMQCWEKKCETVCLNLETDSTISTILRRAQVGEECSLGGCSAENREWRQRWHSDTRTNKDTVAESRVDAAHRWVTDGRGVPGSGKWCLLGKWLSQLELLMDKDKSCHFHIICQVHFQRHKSQCEGETLEESVSVACSCTHRTGEPCTGIYIQTRAYQNTRGLCRGLTRKTYWSYTNIKGFQSNEKIKTHAMKSE